MASLWELTPTHRETSRALEADVKSKKDFRSEEQDSQDSSEQSFERLDRKSKKSNKPETVKSGRNTQFADEQDIPEIDMDVVSDESMEGTQEEPKDEEDHSPRQYHKAEDLEERQKDTARKPKGHAQDAPVRPRENQNTHRRG